MSTYADALRSQAAELNALADLMEQESDIDAYRQKGLKAREKAKGCIAALQTASDGVGLDPQKIRFGGEDATSITEETAALNRQIRDAVQDVFDTTMQGRIKALEERVSDLNGILVALQAHTQAQIADLASKSPSRPDYAR